MLLCLHPLAMLWIVLAHLLRRGDRMDAVVITDDSTRADLEEAMHHVVATLHRMPKHWTDRRAALHTKLDAMLEDWERADH